MNQVKLQLAQEEELHAKATRLDDSSDMSASGFVLLGLDIEDAQYVLDPSLLRRVTHCV